MKGCEVGALLLCCLAAVLANAPARGSADVGGSLGQVPEPETDEGKFPALCPRAAAMAEQREASPGARLSRLEGDADTDVTQYFLDIEIIPKFSGPTVTAVRVEGVCTIDADAEIDGLSTFTVDLRSNLTVNSVTGDVAGWSRVGDTIEITLDRTYNTGEAFQVAVDYSGYPQAGGFGAFRWWDRNGDLVVATLSEPFYAHYWWPCKDALDDKATMQTHITVPDSMVAVSNGTEDGTEPLSGSRLKYRWYEVYPMIPYLASARDHKLRAL